MHSVLKMLFLVGAATASLLLAPRFLSSLNGAPTKSEFLNLQIKYQPFLLAVALLVLFISYWLHPENFKLFLKLGDIRAPATKAIAFGIKDGESWLKIGISLTLVITMGTALFMFMGMRQSGANIWDALPYLPLILLFSLTN